MQSLLPDIGLYQWIMLAAVFLVWSFRIWQHKPPEEALLWSLALRPLATPYVWSWDFVLLLPLFVFQISRSETRKELFFLSGVCLVSWVLMAWIRIRVMSDFYMWWVPWAFLAAVLTTARFREQTPGETSLP